MNGWARPAVIAAVCGVSVHTVRTWARRGQVASACDVRTHRVVLRWVDADRCAEALRKAARAPAIRATTARPQETP